METPKEFHAFLRNLLLVGKCHALLLCGSSFELPIQYVIANATDMDIMYIRTDICALPENVSVPQPFQGQIFRIDAKNTYPGFARLYSPDCKLLYRRQVNNLKDHHSHGPAWTRKIIFSRRTEFVNLIFRNIDCSQYREIHRRLLELKMDRVFAICCPYWPNEADEWKTRDKPNGRPPTERVDKSV